MVAGARKHIHDRHLPDSAIDLIDEAGAARRVNRAAAQSSPFLRREDIEEALARKTGIDRSLIGKEQGQMLRALPERLRAEIFGQDEAIDRLVRAVRIARTGLRDSRRPIGSFLFAGPTGVGKTELVREAAEALGTPLLRFDMSEYREAHTVSRLIGAPAGYTGHEQGGLLTNAVRRNPQSILLLDEIEKANPDIYNLLLQVMDNAELTDSHGRTVNFQGCLIVMTTNAGVRPPDTRQPMGFMQSTEASPLPVVDTEVLKQHFTPEFRNRLDGIVHFNSLTQAHLERMVLTLEEGLRQALDPHNASLEITPAARSFIARAGHDPQMGARPLARYFDSHVKAMISDLLIDSTPESWPRIRVDLNDAGTAIEVKLESLAPADNWLSGLSLDNSGEEQMAG